MYYRLTVVVFFCFFLGLAFDKAWRSLCSWGPVLTGKMCSWASTVLFAWDEFWAGLEVELGLRVEVSLVSMMTTGTSLQSNNLIITWIWLISQSIIRISSCKCRSLKSWLALLWFWSRTNRCSIVFSFWWHRETSLLIGGCAQMWKHKIKPEIWRWSYWIILIFNIFEITI